MTLVEAGFLLSLVQAAGMAAGIAFGVLADALGLRRGMLIGLALLAGASALGSVADSVPWLLALRAVEGFGFLMVVLPAPGLIRRLVVPGRLNVMLGVWGTYMPLGAALGLLAGPAWIAAFGWRSWWVALGALSALMALLLHAGIATAPAPATRGAGVLTRLVRTLSAAGPWLVAISFALYSSQWLAVIGFLPTIYSAAGLAPALTGVLSAGAAAVNMLGNLAAGRLLQRGVAAPRLLAAGFAVMALAAAAAFAGSGEAGLPPALRYAAVLVFSMVGGMVPATLFALAMRVAPGEDTVSTTVGWMQQWSALGQFAGPPIVAWLASRSGGWHWTWLATGAASLAALLLAARLARLPRAA
jgi:CP family cyanate transporter-like MFS transporter